MELEIDNDTRKRIVPSQKFAFTATDLIFSMPFLYCLLPISVTANLSNIWEKALAVAAMRRTLNIFKDRVSRLDMPLQPRIPCYRTSLRVQPSRDQIQVH